MLNKPFFKKTAAVLLALCVWQTAAMVVDEKILIVSPFDVIIRLASIWRDNGFFSSVWFSFSRIVIGFITALLLGATLAGLAGKYKIIETLLLPYMVTIKSVPVASFIIIALIWISLPNLATFISFLMVLPIIYTNVLNGIKSTPKETTELISVFRIPWKKQLIYIWLPQIKPFLFSACNVALGLSWKAGIAAEVIGIPSGSIGESLYYAKVYLNSTDLFAWTVVIVTISILFEKLFMALLKCGYKALYRTR